MSQTFLFVYLWFYNILKKSSTLTSWPVWRAVGPILFEKTAKEGGGGMSYTKFVHCRNQSAQLPPKRKYPIQTQALTFRSSLPTSPLSPAHTCRPSTTLASLRPHLHPLPCLPRQRIQPPALPITTSPLTEPRTTSPSNMLTNLTALQPHSPNNPIKNPL